MPIYTNNNIEEYLSKVTRSNPDLSITKAQKNVEQVDGQLGKEPSRVTNSSIKDNVMLNESSPEDLFRGNGFSGYS